MSVLTLNNILEHRQLVYFYLKELLIMLSHYQCSSLKGTCWHIGMATVTEEFRSVVQEFLLILISNYF